MTLRLVLFIDKRQLELIEIVRENINLFGIGFALLPCMKRRCLKWKVLISVSLFLFSFTAFAGESQSLEIKVANGSRNGNDFHTEKGDLCRSKCDPGKIVVGLNLYTGEHEMLVENVSVICASPNQNDTTIQGETSCGSAFGYASHRYQAICPEDFYLKGVKAWIGGVLDGIQLECAPINYEATTRQELFLNRGVLQDPIYGLNEQYRKDHGFLGIPASYQADLCDKGFFPVELDMWWKKFCWTPNTWDWDDEICYYSIVSGFRAVCGEASLGEEKKTHEIKIDPAGIPYGTSFPDNPEGRGERCEKAICNPGDILVGLEVRTGSLVDNIAVWCSNPTNWNFYKKGDCGGDGGVSHSLRCGMWEYVRSWKMRTGRAADSIQIECASLNTYASTIDDALSGPGWWTWEYGVNAEAREDNGYPAAPPAPEPKKLCPESGTLPSGLDVWHQKFCWANGSRCYDDIVSGARAYCKKASVVVPVQTEIDLSRFFHRDDEVQLIDFVATSNTDSQEDSETPSEEDAPENTPAGSTGQCNGQCSGIPACSSGRIMNFCCTCVVPETTSPNNESNNVGPTDHSNQPDPFADSNTDSAPKSNSSKGGGGCSLNNNASFDPSLAVLFPIALFLLILRRRRLVCH
ncbi:MAG: hypothetical protein A3H42_00285 [Deltaproteobacteria bacterium RIFCSPLOWO2_02_FULL_46_8]|nr:MAG: hypothetical protein A3H42_00285 [Deltaproteobacteria bacterium RIFCSPLOWO2_02_FULL_46_8]